MIKNKNDSEKFTSIYASNQYGKGKQLQPVGKMRKAQPPSELRLIKLLTLISNKLNERFRSFHDAFRFFDTDHSSSISLNEFANVADYLRLKISFEDITRLYRFLDKTGGGAIGYDEFSMLIEENWRSIDPHEVLRENERNREYVVKQETSSGCQDSKRSASLSWNSFADLEKQSKSQNRTKRLPHNSIHDAHLANINREEAP